MSDGDYRSEVEKEFKKSDLELGVNLFEEANKDGRADTDSTKHLLKRIGIHQLVMDRQLKTANCWLFWLSFVMAVGAVASIFQAVFAALAYHRP